MAGYKETPRQKMIGMLYLVLTALLALNVSKEILDAFVVVNETMETTNKNFSQKLDASYAKFKSQYLMDPDKVGPYWDSAQKARTLSNSLIAHIDSLRIGVVAKTENIQVWQEAGDRKLADVARKDNYDTPTQYFIGNSHNGETGRAKVLRDRIEKYREDMLDLLEPKYRDVIQIGLKTEGPYYNASHELQNWQMHNFFHTILAATVTLLNELKAEVLNAEFDVVNNLYASVSAEDFKFDTLAAKVIPVSNYVFVGEDYEAEILVAAYDQTQNPVVRYAFGIDSLSSNNSRGSTLLEGSEGIVTMTLPTSSEGIKKFAGFIKILGPLGDTMTYHFKDEFMVAKPTLTISPTKMNVFYRGVDNPVSISVPGGPETIDASASAGKIRRDGRNWIMYDLPSNRKEMEITVIATFEGNRRNMGSLPFRIKPLPEPIASVGGNTEEKISKGLIKISPVVIAKMPDWFEFNVSYIVTSFTLYIQESGDWSQYPINGFRIPEDKVNQIVALKNNSKILISDIKVKGPDVRTIRSITLTLRP